LVQVAWDGGAVAIDPLTGLDLSPLLAVLGDANIIKIFHAARQDLEIFYRLMGRLPVPLVDTQIMALALGYPDQMAYDRLMNAVLKRKLSKGHRFTDWAKRPLTEGQLEYALGDVTHLLDAYHVILAELDTRGRLNWLDEEHAQMLDEKNYRGHPEDAWQRVKIRTDDPRVLGRLCVVAAWREGEAQRRNLPRSWVMKDEILTELALSAPKAVHSLMNVRGLGKLSADQAEHLLAMMRGAEPIVLPAVPDYQTAPEAVIELLRVLLRHVSEQEKINPRLIASSDDLNNFALGRQSPLTEGWHYEAFGKQAEALIRGELFLGIKNGQLTVQAK
jgi:ribonuclease D